MEKDRHRHWVSWYLRIFSGERWSKRGNGDGGGGRGGWWAFSLHLDISDGIKEAAREEEEEETWRRRRYNEEDFMGIEADVQRAMADRGPSVLFSFFFLLAALFFLFFFFLILYLKGKEGKNLQLNLFTLTFLLINWDSLSLSLSQNTSQALKPSYGPDFGSNRTESNQ